MIKKHSDFQLKAIETVKNLWHMYILNLNPAALEKSLRSLPSDMMMIGTGRHEFYKNLNEFLAGMTDDQIEARDIHFELQDEWYDVQAISEDVCVVFGSIWAREKAVPGKAVLVDMEGSRFTVVCRNTPEGPEICTVHHSMPYLDQGEDEYYPKTLAFLANEAMLKNKALERRVELDHMTELYNRVYMEWYVSQAIKKETGYFIVIDLDDFKKVNDTMGHLSGDRVIREFSLLLKNIFSPSAFIGRMGGDEFAVWDSRIPNKEDAEKHFVSLLEGCGKLSEKLDVMVSCSAGISVSCRTGEVFSNLYQRADRALYHAKSAGKGRLCWEEDFHSHK